MRRLTSGILYFYRLIRVFVLAIVLIFSASYIPGFNFMTKKSTATPGDGHMILFWDGGAAPTDWTCVSCNPGDPFYQVFPRGNDTYGGTGGTTTHTHTASGSVDVTTDPMPARSNTGTGINNNSHTHTFTPTIGSASNLPSYRQLQVIRYDFSGDPATIPAGAIAIFDTTVPSGWTQYSAENGYYPYGESSAGTTGGSNTHTHSITGTLTAAAGGTRARNTASTQDIVSSGGHTHDASGTSASANNEPPYIEIIMGQATSSSAPTIGMYAMWDNDPTTDWIVKSASGGPFNQKFLKASSSYGTTGGSDTHTHADVSYLSGVPSATTTSRTGGTPNASDDVHTHTVHVTNFSIDSNIPPYIDVIIAKLQPPSDLEQSSYRWFANIDSTDVGDPLAAANSAAYAPKQGKPFRLRFTIHVSVTDRDANGAGLKLQFSTRSGTCDTGFSGESYSDVDTASGAIRYYDNATPNDADSLTVNANDPTHSGDSIIAQSYQEANNFTNNIATIANGEDGLWDVALIDFSSPASTTYCFRVVRATDELLETYSVIPEITTDDGMGHMLLFWDGGAVPSGWSCVSCNPGDDFYQRFIRGEASYGATGGADTHTHTADGNTDTSATSGRSSAGSGIIRGHTHTATPTIGSASNLPVYRQVEVIRANDSGTPSTIPSGAIAPFDATVPAGWTRYSAQDGNYIRGELTIGSTGGSNTHSHSISGTTDQGSGVLVAPNTGGTQGAVAADDHTHTFSGTSDTQNNEPPYITTILGKVSSDSPAPAGMLAMWDGPISVVWTSLSSSGGPFYQNFMKPASSYGTTGGSATHAHGTSVLATSTPSNTVNSRTGGTNTASGTHTHNITIDNFSTESNLPPYIDVIIAKLSGSNTAPDSPTSLDQQKPSDLSSISVGGYANANQVKFTAQATDTDNPDDLQLCVEVQQTGTAFTNTPTQCGTAVTYSGSAVSVSVTISGLSDTVSYHWQARIKDGAGATSSWVSFGGNPEANADFIMDSSDPTGIVYDGTSVGVDIDYNDGSLGTLSANWNISDSTSGINGFEYAIGTTIGGNDIAGWTSIGTSTSQTVGSLTLVTSQVYYFSIRATDNADNQTIITSDGQIVAPTLSFSVSSGDVIFNGLNSGNSFTDTQNTTLTTSTNAKNGYVIRAYATDLLRSAVDSIGMFNGGTYASPDSYQLGDTGFGYTSSDTLVQGVNLFNTPTCAGGGTGPCFAPYSTTPPGDIVADHESIVSGTPISNESFTITQRVTTDSSQPSGNYQTVIIYNATAIY